MKPLLYTLFALDFLTLALYLPVFAVHVKSLGATNFQIGIINSTAALISLIWNPILGSLSDSKGRRGLLVNCMAAALIGNLLMACTSSLEFVLVGKILTALGSPINILLKTVVTDVCKSNEEKNALLQQSIIIASAAFMFGSLASGFISDIKNGNYIVFLLIGIIFAIEIILAYNLPNDTKSTTKKSNASFLATALKELKVAVLNIKQIDWTEYWDIFVVKAAYDFSFGIIAANLSLVLVNDYKLTGSQRGGFFMVMSVSRIVTNLLKKKFGKDVNYQQIVYALVCVFVCNIAFGVATPILLFLVLVAIYNMARAFLDTSLIQYVTSKTNQEDRGRVISTFDNLFMLAMFISPLISGLIADWIGERITAGLAAVPTAVAIAVSFSQHKLKKSTKKA